MNAIVELGSSVTYNEMNSVEINDMRFLASFMLDVNSALSLKTKAATATFSSGASVPHIVALHSPCIRGYAVESGAL